MFKEGNIVHKGDTVAILSSPELDATEQGAIDFETHPLGNSYLNYSVYLNNTLVPGIFILLIMITTRYVIGIEWKYKRQKELYKLSGNSPVLALAAKLLPQPVIYTLMSFFMDVWFYCYLDYPCKCGLPAMMLISVLTVLAAQRSYENALQLYYRGIGTAAPVGYIEQRKHGFFHTGWFISVYLPLPTLDEVYRRTTDRDKRDKLASDFMDFTLKLFKEGIIDHDYNASNILAYNDGGRWHFSLVDINRLRFVRKRRLNDEMHAMEQLGASAEDLVRFLPRYAEESGNDIDHCFFMLLIGKLRHKQRNAMKARMKRFLRIGTNPKGTTATAAIVRCCR